MAFEVLELELSAGPLGVNIGELPRNAAGRRVCVVDVKNSASPLREGDFIISMNNIIFAGRSYKDCVAIIRKKSTHSSKMVIHRPYIFLYTEGAEVPMDVRRARVDPSVTVIPARAFEGRERLIEVQLSEGLQEIGERAFCGCKFLRQMNIPSTLKAIRHLAFAYTRLSSIDLPDGVEDIEGGAFGACKALSSMRIPPLINEIARSVFRQCEGMFSLELSVRINRIDIDSFVECRSLRNLAISPGTQFGMDVFGECNDLLQLFSSTEQVKEALMHRFDGLPIHKIMYYQSYHPTEATNEHLSRALNMRTRTSKSGNQNDCLGMTPLHILACSKKQSLELYRVIIEKCPENLITEDNWGGLPLLYACWGGAPGEIIQFLIDSHKSNFPHHELNWGKMVETLSLACPWWVLKNLLGVQQTHFPEQKIDWDNLLDDFARPETIRQTGAPQYLEVFRYLVKFSISERLKLIGLKQWRSNVTDMIEGIPETADSPPVDRKACLDGIRSKLATYERDFLRLKEATSTLELALWKAKIDELTPVNPSSSGKRNKKKPKVDESGFRKRCRVGCGADIIIENVLPYLVEPATSNGPPPPPP